MDAIIWAIIIAISLVVIVFLFFAFQMILVFIWQMLVALLPSSVILALTIYLGIKISGPLGGLLVLIGVVAAFFIFHYWYESSIRRTLSYMIYEWLPSFKRDEN